MSFLRPEAASLMRRWSEPVLMGVLFAGLFWASAAAALEGSALGWAGAALFGLGGAVWIRAAIARARLEGVKQGPGVVMVEERRIGYMGPEHGGFAALEALILVEIVTTGEGPFQDDLFWVLHQSGEPPLIIPGSADGAAGLLDAFEALPGFSYPNVTAAMASTEDRRFVLWRREPGPGAPLDALE